MNNLPNHYAYRQDVIEMMTVAVQLCAYMEKHDEDDKFTIVNRLTCLLPLLYLKVRMLEKPKPELDGFVEQFCSEDDYEAIRTSFADTFGTDDAYLDVMVEDSRYSDEPITCFISENMADIYQEIKDLAANYQTQETSVMNDALLAFLEAFDDHWGQKLLNALRALNVLRLDPDFQKGGNE